MIQIMILIFIKVSVEGTLIAKLINQQGSLTSINRKNWITMPISKKKWTTYTKMPNTKTIKKT